MEFPPSCLLGSDCTNLSSPHGGDVSLFVRGELGINCWEEKTVTFAQELKVYFYLMQQRSDCFTAGWNREEEHLVCLFFICLFIYSLCQHVCVCDQTAFVSLGSSAVSTEYCVLSSIGTASLRHPLTPVQKKLLTCKQKIRCWKAATGRLIWAGISVFSNGQCRTIPSCSFHTGFIHVTSKILDCVKAFHCVFLMESLSVDANPVCNWKKFVFFVLYDIIL